MLNFSSAQLQKASEGGTFWVTSRDGEKCSPRRCKASKANEEWVMATAADILDQVVVTGSATAPQARVHSGQGGGGGEGGGQGGVVESRLLPLLVHRQKVRRNSVYHNS